MTQINPPDHWIICRFQVNKAVAKSLNNKHPWIYRKQCSSALNALTVGCLVRVVGPQNEFLGIGIYEPLSIVAIRIFCFDDVVITPQYFQDKLQRAFVERKTLAKQNDTTGFRWIHGEADGFGGLNIDVYENTAVVVLYLASWQMYLKQVLQTLAYNLGLNHVYLRLPHGQNPITAQNELYDFVCQDQVVADEPVWFQEGGLDFPAFVASGQKTGFYLDLREVRRAIKSSSSKSHNRVLNLFASSGVLSGLVEKMGAEQIVSVEVSSKCQMQFLELQKVWNLNKKKHIWHTEDVWDYLKSEDFKNEQAFDVIILDPPALAKSKESQKHLQKVWSGLVNKVLPKLNEGGLFFTICCTDRISKHEHANWTKSVAQALKIELKCVQKIKDPFDHPAHPLLKERDYFHAYQWQKLN